MPVPRDAELVQGSSPEHTKTRPVAEPLHQPRHAMPMRFSFLFPLTLLLATSSAHAQEFVSSRGIPDQVLVANIEKLVNYILTNEVTPKKPVATITRLLGKEDLGFSKAKIWFCMRKRVDEQQVESCSNNIRLIRLDTGLWVLEDEQSGTWIIAQK